MPALLSFSIRRRPIADEQPSAPISPALLQNPLPFQSRRSIVFPRAPVPNAPARRRSPQVVPLPRPAPKHDRPSLLQIRRRRVVVLFSRPLCTREPPFAIGKSAVCDRAGCQVRHPRRGQSPPQRVLKGLDVQVLLLQVGVVP